jgi:predicted DNA-binding transcriptional regulator YafY
VSDDSTTRALRLLSLLQTDRFWSGVELVRELGVSSRTVRRDIDRLRSLGYPVDATTGSTGGYRLARGTAIPPLVLDDDEAVAIAVGLRSSASAAITGIEETSLRALAKLEQVLPDRLRRRVNAINSNTSTIVWSTSPSVEPDALALLAQGCRDREEVRFDYLARNGEPTRRLVEPYQLVSAGRRWYLVAFDVRRNDWRSFRLDRLTDAKLAGRRFELRTLPAKTFTAFVSESVQSARSTHRGTATVSCQREDLNEFVQNSGAIVDKVDDNRYRVTIEVDSPIWLLGLVSMLASLGDVTIDDPPELRNSVVTLVQRLQPGNR